MYDIIRIYGPILLHVAFNTLEYDDSKFIIYWTSFAITCNNGHKFCKKYHSCRYDANVRLHVLFFCFCYLWDCIKTFLLLFVFGYLCICHNKIDYNIVQCKAKYATISLFIKNWLFYLNVYHNRCSINLRFSDDLDTFNWVYHLN